MKTKKIEVGDMFQANEGGSVTVIEYRNSREVVIKHNDRYGHVATVTAGQLRNGEVKNPYRRSVYGVGFVGVGEHTTYINGKHTPAYKTWRGMLKRCYDPKYHARNPTYIGCSVSAEWHNFQNFAEWFEKQYRADGFELDKDLLAAGNKVYSADTCVFIPQQLNKLLNDRGNAHGDLPQGVTRDRKGYRARLRIDGKQHYLGTYVTPEEAFQAYKKAKEANVKRMAEKWRFLIEHCVYIALLRHEVKP